MIEIVQAQLAQKIRRGDFNIDLNFPGITLRNGRDPRGLGQLGRFDRGHLLPGVFVGMHPHVNDEILSYLRTGEMVHEDTEGHQIPINSTKLMMMNAGSGIEHQESIPKDGKEVNMLQIFMRPSKVNLKPRVQFSDFEEPYSKNEWRLVAGPASKNPPLEINSEVSVYDIRLEYHTTDLILNPSKTYVLYVFEGEISSEDLKLSTGDMLIYDEPLEVKSSVISDLVLFELDLNATYTREGMYSGV